MAPREIVPQASPEQIALIKANAPNFSPEELMCPCCGKLDMKIDVLTKLQALRNYMKMALRVNSGFRCLAHNRAVGGKSESYHLKGEAVDISLNFTKEINTGGTKISARLHAMIQMCTHLFNGVGIAKSFVHCDTRTFKALWHY